MPILSSEILFKLSTKSGSAGNTLSGTPSGSLGKYISTTVVDTGVTLNNLFDDVSGDENAASDIEYRCFFIHNSNSSLTWQNPYLWISGQVAGGASGFIGIDPTNASPIGTGLAQAVEIADESSAPSGVVFSAPESKVAGLALGNIQAGYCKAVWIRRNAYNTSAVNNDGLTIKVEGDSAA